MLLKDARDLFIVKYKFECLKRGTKEISMGDKIIAFMISEAQQDICNKLKIGITFVNISLLVGTTSYALPTKYGGLKGKPIIDGLEVDVKNLNDLKDRDASDNSIAVYHDGTGYKVYCNPTEAQTLKVWYYVNPHYYSPTSVTTAQDWGTFDGSTFTGSLAIPDEYIDALQLHMLSKIFDDLEIKYLNKISELKGNSFETVKDSFDYSFDGAPS